MGFAFVKDVISICEGFGHFVCQRFMCFALVKVLATCEGLSDVHGICICQGFKVFGHLYIVHSSL